MIDLRFPTALQMMLNLAQAQERGDEPVSSAVLARSLGANRSLVRTMLVPLAKAGLIVSVMGKAGGASLSRPAGQISYREIYEAVVGDKPLWSPREDVPCVCVVSAHIEDHFAAIAAEAEEAAMSGLTRHNLAQGLAALRAKEAISAPGNRRSA